MVLVALFSGGKDSTYSILRSLKLGVKVEKLLFVKPSFPYPSPHDVNFESVLMLSKLMNMPMTRVELRRGSEIDDLARKLMDIKAEALVAGDILLEEHLSWHEKVCRKAGIDLYEPLYGSDTRRLLEEMINQGLEFTIVAVSKSMPRELIGRVISNRNLKEFIALCDDLGVDYLGEYGEYHTLVNTIPGLSRVRIVYDVVRVVSRGEYGWLAVVKPKLGSFSDSTVDAHAH